MSKTENPEMMHDRMVLIANLYYRNKLSQAEIAKRLGISRPWVSRLLTKAEEVGIVQIRIESAISGEAMLGEQLKEKYQLHYVGVVDTESESRDSLALAAANYFVSQMHTDDVVGIGWGDTVYRFLQELPQMQCPQVEIVPLSGSFGMSRETLPNYVAMRMADLLGGTATLLHAPAFCESQAEYEAMVHSEATRTVLSKAEKADIAVLGFGSLQSSFVIRNHVLTEQDLEMLKADHAVGDIALQFLNPEGQPVQNDFCNRIIKADMLQLRKNAREVIGIAQGKDKLEIIRAVLRNHLITSFLTDKETAMALLAM